TYSWTTSANISPTTFTTTSNTFTPVANGSGTGWVKVRVTNTCSGNTYESGQFPVVVGIAYSSSDYPVSGPTSADCNQEVAYSTNTLAAATNYQWSWPSGWSYVSGQGTRYLTVKTPSFSSSGQVSVRVATSCDAGGSAATLNVSATCSGLMYAMYPNPADSYVEITPDETKPDNQAAGQDFEVVLYDNFALEKLRAKTRKEVKEKKLKLDVTSFSPGIYVVQIIHADGVEQKQLEIMR
ncbi:MAG: T9SS type A sorting domain-containing protein, partial [Cytophagales bacterium]|nr:T9SS type A sorting domain-containing protein [Cytophagales bacterium]